MSLGFYEPRDDNKSMTPQEWSCIVVISGVVLLVAACLIFG